MTPVDPIELIDRANRLLTMAREVTPEQLLPVMANGLDVLARFPENPDILEDASAAYCRAAREMKAVGEEIKGSCHQLTREQWWGTAASACFENLSLEGDTVVADAAVFRGVGHVLGDMALDFRTAKQLNDLVCDSLKLAVPLAAVGLMPLSLARKCLRAGSNVFFRLLETHNAAITRLERLLSGPDGVREFAVHEAQPDSRRPISEITDVHAATDPRGVMQYVDPFGDWMGAPLMTVGETAMLNRLNAIKKSQVIYSCWEADNASKTVFDGHGSKDGHSDAVQHGTWSALLTQRFGPQWTEEYTNRHERLPAYLANTATAESMDIHNNLIGRRIGKQYPDATPGQIVEQVKQAVLRGEMVVHDDNGLPVYSDEVRVGESAPARGRPVEGGF